MIAGMDVSTRRLAVVVVGTGGHLGGWRTWTLPGTDQERCGSAYTFAADRLAWAHVDTLAIELPPMVRSPRIHAQLAMIVGAVTAAATCPVAHVTVQEWKRALGVSGNAGKPTVAAYVLRRWPELPADDQDVLDAAGIAWWALTMREAS